VDGWGIGWEDLRSVNPELVMVRITGYGQKGPNAHRPGFGCITNAFGGLSFLAGDPGRPPSTPGLPTIPDYFEGLYGALMAVRAREKTGEGSLSTFVSTSRSTVFSTNCLRPTISTTLFASAWARP